MRIFLPSLALASLITSTGAFAQDARQAQTWETEPSEFMGVPLHGDFKTQLPECAKNPPRQRPLCWTNTADSNRYEIRGLPYIPISPGYQLFASIQNNQISQLMLTGRASSLAMVDDFLTDTLGQPGSSLVRTIKLSSGSTYETKTITWEGKKVAVRFQRNEADLSRYAVIFTLVDSKTGSMGINTNAETSHDDSITQ